MRPKVRKARRQASKLHGATAGYVSLVDRGANETPFTMIKSAEGAKTMAIKKRGKTTKSHKKVSGGRKQETKTTQTVTEMAKMVFSADVFEDEQAVLDQIEKMEWEAEGFDIAQNGDGDWEARVEGTTDDDYENLSKVELDDDDDDDMEGIEAFIGKREVEVKDDDTDDDNDDDDDTVTASDDTDDDDDADTQQKGKKKPYKKAAPKKPAVSKKSEPKKVSKRSEFIAARKAARKPERKFDAWDARFSKGNTLAKTLADGMDWDGLPPGYYEVQAAFSSAIGNIVAGEGMPEGDKQEALNKTSMEFAEIVGGLDTFFDAYVEADEETVEKLFDDGEAREALAKWADEYAGVIETKGEQPETQAKSVGAIDYNEISDAVSNTVAALISKAVDPLNEKIEKTNGTVESLAARRPTKKANAPDDLGDGQTNDADEADATLSRFGKSFLG